MSLLLVWNFILTWIPETLAIPFLGLAGVLAVLTIMRIVKIVLDCLPFR